MFMKNVAYEYEGGAIFLSNMTSIISGNISFINNGAFFSGALSNVRTKLLLNVNKEQLLNEKFIYSDAVRFCLNVAINGGVASIACAAEYVGVLESSYRNYNESVKGMAVFCGNVASWEVEP